MCFNLGKFLGISVAHCFPQYCCLFSLNVSVQLTPTDLAFFGSNFDSDHKYSKSRPGTWMGVNN